jgi:predicted nucleotidyltransferase
MKLATKSIVAKLKPLKPNKIILFGSYAKGTAKKSSDVDLLIVKNTTKKPSDRVAEVLKLTWGFSPRIEPQILTPEEFDNAIKENHYFITEILKHGQIIYQS